MEKKLICFFDGACAPKNPHGHIGMGYFIKEGDVIIHAESRYREARNGNTNNIAEYGALYYLLKYLIDNQMNSYDIQVFGDSTLVIHQMSLIWKIKKGGYAQAAMACKELLSRFNNIRFTWIPREENKLADQLSNKILLEKGIKLFQKPTN